MQHERVGIGSEFGDDKWDALNHKSGYEGNVTRQSIELGNNDRTLCLSRLGEGGCQLWAPVQGIRTLAGLDLSEIVEDRDAFGFGEAGDCCTLGQPRSALPLR
jgi:hypothetical protein